MKYLIALLMSVSTHAAEVNMFGEVGAILNDNKMVFGGGFDVSDKVVPGLITTKIRIGTLPDKFASGQYIVMEPSLTLTLEDFSITPRLSAMHLNGVNHYVASATFEVKVK